MADTGGTGYVSQIGDKERISEAVLRAIAAVSNRPLLDLPPLQESVNTDALDQLFASSTVIESLHIEYAGYKITVEPERIHVRERQ